MVCLDDVCGFVAEYPLTTCFDLVLRAERPLDANLSGVISLLAWGVLSQDPINVVPLRLATTRGSLVAGNALVQYTLMKLQSASWRLIPKPKRITWRPG